MVESQCLHEMLEAVKAASDKLRAVQSECDSEGVQVRRKKYEALVRKKAEYLNSFFTPTIDEMDKWADDLIGLQEKYETQLSDLRDQELHAAMRCIQTLEDIVQYKFGSYPIQVD